MWDTVVVGGVALGAYVAGLFFWRRYWLIADTPTSRCAAVVVGRNEVIGRAEQRGKLASPVTGEPCVWFRWQLDRWVEDKDSRERDRDRRKVKLGPLTYSTSTRRRRSHEYWGSRRRRRGTWKKVEERSSRSAFWVADDSGRVLVRPGDAAVRAPRTFRRLARESGVERSVAEIRALSASTSRKRREALDKAQRVLSRSKGKGVKGLVGAAATELSGWERRPLERLGDRYRITEWRIEPGRELYVLGPASLRKDAVALELTHQGGNDSLVVNAFGRRRASLESLGLAVLFLLGGGWVVTQLPGTWGAGRSAAVTAGALYAVVVVAAYGIRLHGRLVDVKHRAALAWSSIDVALRRRHDLLPNLVSVTKRYAQHEQETLAAVAARSVDTVLPPAGELPSDEGLRKVADLDRQEREATRATLALGESYPDLLGDEVFQDLATRIVQSEDQVAYARSFYNDSITILRDRRQSFPGILFAGLVKTPSWNLYDAEIRTPDPQGTA